LSNSTQYTYLALVLLLMGCVSTPVPYSDNSCKTNAAFISKLGFNPASSFFSTSEKRIMGLVLNEAANPADLTQGITRQYQDSSWRQAGWLAPLQIDEMGNLYTAPAPFISVLHNPPQQQNNIYKVDAATGKMKVFVQLPQPDTLMQQVKQPFGIIGLAYLCETGSLYASSIAGSTIQKVAGEVYQIDVKTGEIKDKLPGMDILGLGIAYTTGKRLLFGGDGRSSTVYAVVLTAQGNFSGTWQPQFSLAGIGPRGDDRVRRIKCDKNGDLLVYGMEFNYNLIAPSEKQETSYRFSYNAATNQWDYQPQ
jgi:hypothetical protein